MADAFQFYADSVIAPARNLMDVTPSDTTDLLPAGGGDRGMTDQPQPWWIQKRVLLSVSAAVAIVGGGLMLLRHWAGW